MAQARSSDASEPSSTLMDELLSAMESTCRVKALLDSMPVDLAEQTVAVLKGRDHRGREFSTASLLRALEKRGIKTDRHQINNCRRDCNCAWDIRRP